MHTLDTSLRLSQPAERAWRLLRAFDRASDYYPKITLCESRSDQSVGVGARRYIEMSDGTKAVQQVVEYDEEERRVAYEIVDCNLPLRFATIRHEVVALDDGGCEIRTQVDYALKYGVLGVFLNFVKVGGELHTCSSNMLKSIAAHLDGDDVDVECAITHDVGVAFT